MVRKLRRAAMSLPIYPQYAAKLGSRVPAMVTFGCLHGIIDPIGARDETRPYPSHGPELERWAILLWCVGDYLSRLGRLPGYLPEPLLAPNRASGFVRCIKNLGLFRFNQYAPLSAKLVDTRLHG